MIPDLLPSMIPRPEILLVIALAAAPLLIKHFIPSNKRPPGPPGWPIVGNLLGLSFKGTWKALTEYKKTYGDIIYFYGLGNGLLVLNSMEAINDLLDKRGHIYSDRPVLTVLGELMALNQAMPLKPYGEEWREQRKVAHIALSHGAVKKYHGLQEHLALLLCNDIIQNPLDFFGLVRLTAGRIIVSVTYGLTVESAQNEFITMAEETMEIVGKGMVPGTYICDFLPILKHLPAWVPFRAEAAMGKAIIEEFVSKPFRQVRRDISLGSASPSLVRDLLSSDEISLDHEYVVKWAAGSMYGAGAETTYATTLTFIMAMALNPDKQKLAQAELDRVIGDSRMPRIQDRENLPYLGAVIKETSRWHPVLPLSLARRNSVDDWYRGYYIPKGTVIIPNLWGIAFSPDGRYDPQAFVPERFLDNDCAAVDPGQWNFGFGRRVCPGRALAENSVFILAASLLWTFTFSVDESEGLVPQFTEELVSYPKPFKCVITPRSHKHMRWVQDAVANESE